MSKGNIALPTEPTLEARCHELKAATIMTVVINEVGVLAFTANKNIIRHSIGLF